LTRPPLARLALIRVSDTASILVWSYHHVLLDRWSVEVVLQEILGAYEALRQGRSLQSAEPRPYRDYLGWLQQQEVARAEDYWRHTLGGFSAPTLLGVDQAPAPVGHQASRYKAQDTALSEASTLALHQWARQRQLTLNTLVQGAWAILLSRYSDTDDVVFGATVSGRSADLPGMESMVGLFINTLPVRAVVTPSQSVVTWLTALQARQVASRQYEYAPLFEIQKWSEVPNGVPLFSTLLVFENTPRTSDEFAAAKAEGITLQQVPGGSGGETTYPLTVVVLPGQTLKLLITYDTEHYTDTAIRRLVSHFRQVLESMISEPEQALGDIPLLTAPERRQLLVEWNDTKQAYSEDACIQDLFAAQVERVPDAVAVEFCAARQLTYRELDARANQLAHYLRRLGVGPDVLVGLCVNRSLELVIGVLGILKAGGGYVPLDPTYPSDRLRLMLEETRTNVVVTQTALQAQVPPTAAHVLCLDRDEAALAQESTETPNSGVSGEHLAYVIFTSGSTGKPKGVALCHRTLTNLIEWQAKAQRSPRDSTTLQFASLSFDVSCQEIFSTLGTGGRLLMIPESVRADFQELLDVVDRHSVARMFLPFVALQQLASSAEEHGRFLPSLNEVITAGEQLKISDSIAQFMNHRPDGVLVNQYGPSESHVVTSHELAGSPEDWPALPPIGRPIDNTQMYVLDAWLEPVPIGVMGDLYIGGTSLARGYVNRPELTAERFVPDPFSEDPGARLYKTGDKARYQPDGALEFLGRRDHQVKLRGYRVELGEIEAVLSQHPAVRETVVLVREETPENQQLVAYVVGAQKEVPSISEFRSFLKSELPDYMIPTAFVMMDALPLTPTGKVDRLVLPEPDNNLRELVGNFVPPRNPTEATLAQIWQNLLRVEQVGVHDNFFELGGHSLLATQVVSRIQKEFHVDLKMAHFFEMPTVAELAEGLEGLLWINAGRPSEAETESQEREEGRI
jgi:amino acid adenylation domain-containing protein